jgi:glycerol-3-phosphate dehydrogenase (NAD(P)+)
VVTVAKGFDEADGRIRLLPDVIAELCDAPVVAVGGPSKANEVARGLPTAVVFAGTSAEATGACREAFATPAYRIETSADIIGVEVAAAMKNAYAIALGMTDGFERRTGLPHHNLRAALFPRAVREMGGLAEALGGRRATIDGLAGGGDLQVTITSGRNRMLGERIGFGEPPDDALAALTAAGTTVEGYLAVGYGYRLAHDLTASEDLGVREVALLRALWRILHEGAPPLDTLWMASSDEDQGKPE